MHLLNPSDLRPGDEVTFCGQRETVAYIEDSGDGWVYVGVKGPDLNDPFMVRPHEIVPVHSRA